MDKSKYEYIFLDVGNVIFHDIAVDMVFSYFIFERLNNVGKINFFETREKELKRGNLSWIYDYCNKNKAFPSERVAEDAWKKVLMDWESINVPIDGAMDSIKKLCNSFSVIIAANQPIETKNLLGIYNITEIVDGVFLDSTIGVSKPDDLFFQKLLTVTGINANEALYVGDRIDNDVIPSQRNGLTPIWIQYCPVPIESQYVPNWWGEKFYSSYLNVGPYNFEKFTKKYSDKKFLNIFSSLSNFEECVS